MDSGSSSICHKHWPLTLPLPCVIARPAAHLVSSPHRSSETICPAANAYFSTIKINCYVVTLYNTPLLNCPGPSVLFALWISHVLQGIAWERVHCQANRRLIWVQSNDDRWLHDRLRAKKLNISLCELALFMKIKAIENLYCLQCMCSGLFGGHAPQTPLGRLRRGLGQQTFCEAEQTLFASFSGKRRSLSDWLSWLVRN
jgi:hypothetical protein